MDIELQIDESDYGSMEEGGTGRAGRGVTRSTDGTLVTTKGLYCVPSLRCFITF